MAIIHPVGIVETLSKDCNYTAVSADVYRDEAIRDAFINGMLSNYIRQRLLENKDLDLTQIYNQARSLDSAQKQADSYFKDSVNVSAATVSRNSEEDC